MSAMAHLLGVNTIGFTFHRLEPEGPNRTVLTIQPRVCDPVLAWQSMTARAQMPRVTARMCRHAYRGTAAFGESYQMSWDGPLGRDPPTRLSQLTMSGDTHPRRRANHHTWLQ
jgi:hypothetical protein